MGRREAPEPLPLPDDSGSGSLGEGFIPTDGPVLVEPAPMGHDERLNPASLQVAATPTSSRSPRSPRSPFERPNAPTPHTPVHIHSPSEPPQADILSQFAEIHRPPYSVDDTNAHPQFRHIRQEIANRPKTSAGQQHSSKQPSQQRRGQAEHSRSASRFWAFGKSSKTNQFRHIHTNSSSEGMLRGVDFAGVPERVSNKKNKSSETDLSSADPSNHKAIVPLPSRSDTSLTSTSEYDNPATRKNKQKPFGLLGRNKSLKEQDDNGGKETAPGKGIELERPNLYPGPQPLRTAPIHLEGPERPFRHMMPPAARNHSADRALIRDGPANKDGRHDKDNRSHPSSFRETSGSAFLNGLKVSGSWAFDMGRQFFTKTTRSGSNAGNNTGGEPVVDDEHYVLKVINLPLVEQTRLTRISKRLEDSRDKTEFWMPAFPWRAIDYLNYKGTEVEGLYRVPGSGPQIKKWQRKFDEEGDVDLFAQDDLYDINIVGSMLKAWLRELPDELFPKDAQERVARECAGTDEVPPLLIEELSNLSPFNYYLLFAITCHLSLLLAHSDKNKMDFRNLCICFQPCMKIDAFCFKFLVCDWRHCWQGCKNEARYIEEEYTILNEPVPRILNSTPLIYTEPPEDRNISSSDSSTQLTLGPDELQNGKLRNRPLASGPSNGSMTSDSTAATSLTANSREPPRKFSSELRPLSPIKPLSPLGF